MKILPSTALVAVGGLLVWLLLATTPDLRGWAPGDPTDIAPKMQATTPGGTAFTRDMCLPGSVNPYASPRVDEYSGTATVTVFACRSTDSAARWLGFYALLSLLGLLALRAGKMARARARSS